jgi:hypothetical protein
MSDGHPNRQGSHTKDMADYPKDSFTHTTGLQFFAVVPSTDWKSVVQIALLPRQPKSEN